MLFKSLPRYGNILPMVIVIFMALIFQAGLSVATHYLWGKGASEANVPPMLKKMLYVPWALIVVGILYLAGVIH